MTLIRVIVVEDSLTARRRLVSVLESDPDIEVVGEAGDGRGGIELCSELHPDVMTLDMMMPGMSGLAATEYIMAHHPTPILIVSSSYNRGELFKTYDALAAGAVEVLDKPRGDEADGVWEAKFLAMVKLVARIKVITHPRGRLGSMCQPIFSPKMLQRPPPLVSSRHFRVVGIGASTGGPGAIVELLSAIPTSFQLPILVVLHVDKPFGSSFADWLDAQTHHRVSQAFDREPVSSVVGRVVVAPPGSHLIVEGGQLRLTFEPERNFCRPSIDVLFESLAREYGASTAACLLTGMGADGAAGLLQIRQVGGLTIGQNEESCIVYGMPREAALRGAVETVLPLNEIGTMLANLNSESKGDVHG